MVLFSHMHMLVYRRHRICMVGACISWYKNVTFLHFVYDVTNYYCFGRFLARGLSMILCKKHPRKNTFVRTANISPVAIEHR